MVTEDVELTGFTGEQVNALTELLRRRANEPAPLSDAVARLEATLTALRQDFDARIESARKELAALGDGIADLRPPQVAMREAIFRREAHNYLAATRPPFLSPDEEISFDWICVESENPAALTAHKLFLEVQMLHWHYAEIAGKVGAIRANAAWRFGQNATARLSRRLARRFAAQLGLPEELLAEALHYPILRELMCLIPARHVARHLARQSGGEPVLIPINRRSVVYLHARELEPFYIAAELRRRQVPVAFICTDAEVMAEALSDDPMTLNFVPNPMIWTQPAVREQEIEPAAGGRAGIAGSGIRGVNYILRHAKSPLTFHTPYPMNGNKIDAPDLTIIDPDVLPVAVYAPMERVARTEHASVKAVFLRVNFPYGDYGLYLANLLGWVIKAAYVRTKQLVQRHDITEAHICEHPFIESAILAQAVRERGGKVVMWPHGGWGVSWIGRRPRPGLADVVYAANESSAALWRQELPGAEVKVVSELCFSPDYQRRPVVPSAPLEVVVIGTPYVIGRLPYIDRHRHEATSSHLYSALARLAPQVQWIYRGKEQQDVYEQWRLNELSPHFRHAVESPSVIDLPNMVFVFTGLLSTALIEGICRGIPAIIVREDHTIEDYLGTVMPPCVPTGGVDFAIEEIKRCCDPVYRQALAERQIDWCDKTQLRWPPSN